MTAADALARAALARVVSAHVVTGMRGDSPLPLAAADLVALADAVADASPGVLLGDDDLTGVATLADLVSAIDARAQSGAR